VRALATHRSRRRRAFRNQAKVHGIEVARRLPSTVGRAKRKFANSLMYGKYCPWSDRTSRAARRRSNTSILRSNPLRWTVQCAGQLFISPSVYCIIPKPICFRIGLAGKKGRAFSRARPKNWERMDARIAIIAMGRQEAQSGVNPRFGFIH